MATTFTDEVVVLGKPYDLDSLTAGELRAAGHDPFMGLEPLQIIAIVLARDYDDDEVVRICETLDLRFHVRVVAERGEIVVGDDGAD